jgi:ABC-type nitrate/sulfonate/bicarbonate transport system substrate-binding protein/outer membrane protein OmpA-like peptidoglycan-associated protein
MRSRLISALCLSLVVTCAFGAETTIKPLDSILNPRVGDVKSGGTTTLPIITWGGEFGTLCANGNSILTTPNSLFGKAGLKFKLSRMDDFQKQVDLYMSGGTPYLRGTLGMINSAMDVLSQDPRTKPVIIYQLTWSSGGDCVVVKPGIDSIKDLRGKTVAIQSFGPHMIDYAGAVLKDGGLTMKDVNIVWTKDITGTEDSPGEVFRKPEVSAAFVISSDASVLTSKGTVGTGADASVKGARTLMSTKSANRIIADVYAVRSDYFKSHRGEVQKFVHSLLLAAQEVSDIFKNKSSRISDYKKTVTAGATILFDSPQAVGDADGLFGDCEYVGFAGNVKFFTDEKWPRSFGNVTEELQAILLSSNLLKRKYGLEQANWNYSDLKAGLTGTELVVLPKFKTEEVSKIIAKKESTGTLGEGELFSFEIFFQPNQNDFGADLYSGAFKKAIDLASTYGGALMLIQGHSDPLGYLKKKQSGADDVVLKKIEQAGKNLSLTRAMAVRNSLMDYAKAQGVALDVSQFTVNGVGFGHPKTGMCGKQPCAPKTKDQWLSNMRVVFKIIQIEAEESAFSPLK